MGANLKISGVNSKKWNNVERFAFVKTKCLVITSEMEPSPNFFHCLWLFIWKEFIRCLGERTSYGFNITQAYSNIPPI